MHLLDFVLGSVTTIFFGYHIATNTPWQAIYDSFSKGNYSELPYLFIKRVVIDGSIGLLTSIKNKFTGMFNQNPPPQVKKTDNLLLLFSRIWKAIFAFFGFLITCGLAVFSQLFVNVPFLVSCMLSALAMVYIYVLAPTISNVRKRHGNVKAAAGVLLFGICAATYTFDSKAAFDKPAAKAQQSQLAKTVRGNEAYAGSRDWSQMPFIGRFFKGG